MKWIKRLLSYLRFFTLFLPIILPWNQALADSGGYRGWNMGPGMMGGWGMGGVGMIFMMVFWILIILGLVFLIKWLIQSTGGDKASRFAGNRALEILKERYARGEIDKDEFENRKKDLSG